MKVFRKSKKFIFLGIALMLMLCLSDASMYTAQAAQATGSISLSYELESVEFRLYKIGTVNGGQVQLTGDFAGYAVDMSSDNSALTLETYVIRDNLSPIAKAETGKDKTLKFDNLDDAAYLICGETVTVDNIRYTASPSLVYLPALDGGTVTKNVTIQNKHETEDISKKTDISVVIVWKDYGFEGSRPFRLMILLLREGEAVDKVELNEENNWSHTWEDLDGNYEWTIVEESVTEGYEVTTEKDGRTYIITKAKDGDEKPATPPDNPPKPSTPVQPDSIPPVTTPSTSVEGKLPQTGQLWWPVYTLVCVGLLFMIIGVLCKRRDCQ